MGKQINVALCLGFLLAPALQVAAAPQDPIASTTGDDAARKKQIEAEVRRLEAMFDKAQDEEKQTVVLRGITMDTLIELVAQRTKFKYKFLYSEAENLANVRLHYIVPDGELPKTDEEWFHFLKKVMAVSGYALLELKQKNETVYHVKNIAAPTGVSAPLPLVAKRMDGPLGDLPAFEYIARYIELRHISTAEAVEIINQILGQTGTGRAPAGQGGNIPIIELPVAGKILVVNYDYIVKRIEEILREADRPQEELVLEIITLRNALSTQIKDVLEPMLEAITSRAPPSVGPGVRRTPPGRTPPRPTAQGTGGASQEVIQITSDVRTNSLIVLAEPYRIKRIKEIIKQIDEASGVGTFVVQVYRLKNTKSGDMVSILGDVFSGQVTAGATGSQNQPRQPRQPQQPQGPGSDGASGLGGLHPPTIVPDEPSNAVIVIADRNTQRKIEALISQLDVRRPQVYLKCTVVQITASDSFDIGLELAALEAPKNGEIKFGGRTNFGQSTVADIDGDGVPDIVPDTTLAGASLFLFKDRIGQLLANLHLNEGVTHIRVLEEPELIALDNTMAQVRVEVNVAVLRNDVTGTGILTTVFDHFEPASTILTISPRISEGGYVNLGLEILVEKFLGTVSENTTIPPPKTTRQIFTNVNVPDRHTVVIGGLITNDASESTQGVPFLWKIPILGHLFRRDQSDSTKTTLYVFVTPTILFDENYSDLREVSATRKEEMDIQSSPLDQLDTGPPTTPSVKDTWKPGPVLRRDPMDYVNPK